MDEGVCHIKAEYIVIKKPEERNPDEKKVENAENGSAEEPPSKKQKFDKKKNRRGQNKSRGKTFTEDVKERLCKSLFDGKSSKKDCQNTNCRFSHDLEQYLQLKPKDIGETCYIYSLKGYCDFGVTCRYGKAHLDAENNNVLAENLNRDEYCIQPTISYELQQLLRKKNYKFEKSNEIVEGFEKLQKEEKAAGSVTDEDTIKIRDSERKRIVFKDKLYLGPLTTVGNLPFRRICKEYGADITCGEMACSIPIINGALQEWALTKRHSSEDLFGVQICGHKSKLITYAAQVLSENINVDFIDINLGCPIDLIFNQGGGSALLRRQNVLEVIVRSCSKLLNDCGKEFTIKTRTGIQQNKNVAHDLIPKFEEWGASLVTIHGRTKEQRYTKKADFEYIERCAALAKNIPIFGNGDILSYQDYVEAREKAKSLSGIMIGRGALIKPWIFSEIKEEKLLDPSSSERFEMMKKYVNYGLEHWGSDTKGVENTRKFLLEWQSFLYRYVPTGLLENPPQKINQRPETFMGRDDLETLMASSNCADWVKLSEMLLGPVPDGFNFLPKHKANSY